MKISAWLCLSLVPVVSILGCSSHKAPVVSNHFPGSTMSNSQVIDGDNGEVARAETAPELSEDKNNQSKKENGDDELSLLDTALELTESSQEYWVDGDLEKAIEALDQAYSSIIQVDPEDNPKLSQQKEDLRFMISKRIMELYASRNTSVKGHYNAIPLTMNKHVEFELKQFQTIERSFFIESYRRSGKYRPEIVKALKEAGIPEDLSWLPLIESGFKVRALSRARALGLWQFIPSTGYKFGLKRNDWIDERLDPVKATTAAIAYMRELHNMFGDWATVLAAYNCGEGAVARAIRTQKISYLDNFWDFYERLPRETARYLPRFLATLLIIKNPEQYGFTLNELDSPVPYDTVPIEKPVHLKSVAEKLGVSLEEITSLNPELRRDATPDISYALRVPSGKGPMLVANLDSISKWTPPKAEYVYHRVRRGETLSLIASKYRTSMQRIMESNRLRSARYLRVGQRLKIPMRGTT